MADKCLFFVCANHAPEISKVIEQEKFHDIDLKELPVTCVNPSRFTPDDLAELIKGKEEGSDYIFLSGLCGIRYPNSRIPEISRKTPCLNCFEIFINRELILDYLRRGAYFISSGMLIKWKEYISELGFDKETANDFFGKSARFLVWLDTGVDEEGNKHINSISEFTGLPYQKVPVGLDYIRLVITKEVSLWRAKKQRKELSETLADHQRKIADFAMALDLLGNLPGAVSESEVISKVMQLLNAICAPKTLVYVPFADSKPGDPVICSVNKYRNQDINTEETSEKSSWTTSENGFTIEVKRENDLLGKILLDDFEFPQYRNYYLNFALSTNNVISLAVSNSRIYERLVETREDLAAANKELEAFSYSVAHDLRIPLRAITGFSEFLMEDYREKLGETGNDYINRILSASSRMSQLIDDLLRLARIGTQQVMLTQVNLSEMINEITDNLRMNDPQRKATFNIIKGISVTADSRLIRIALENLLSNAWKFTEKCKETYICFGEAVDEGKRVYYVKDNGAGFNMEHANRLFEPFQRLHTIKEFQGTGIGLSIVRRIIQRHGGKIWAEGEKNKGAVFYFTLR